MVSIIVAVSVVLLIIVIWRSRALIKHYNISGDPAGAMQRVVVEQPSMNDTTARRFSDSGICLNILKGTTYSSDESLGTNKLSLLVSRAIPKQRLVRAFGIDNGFTTFDPEKRADFLSEARERLAEVTRYGWEGIASTAEDVTEKYVEKISRGIRSMKRSGEWCFIVSSKSCSDHQQTSSGARSCKPSVTSLTNSNSNSVELA